MTAFAIVLGSANANANACGNAHAADSANAYGLANAADSANAYGLANAIAHDFANVQPGSPVMIYPIELTFTRGYIAHPYWPELEKLINIQKESGTRRARSEEKRVKALRDYLTAHDMSTDDYERLQARAERQFYTFADVGDDNMMSGRPGDEITIPAHQLYGCLAQAADLASSAIRIARKEQIRTVVQISNVSTGKARSDGVWERFVQVKSGTGQTLSNQRALRSNQYLGPFVGNGFLQFSEDIVPYRKMVDFVEFAGREIGVGASRKLGWGRFTIRIDDAQQTADVVDAPRRRRA